MKCPVCQTSLVDEARFCASCGSDLSKPRTMVAGGAASTVDALTGKMVAQRYRVVAKLGQGGMGTVYRAEQVSLKRAVALKVLDPALFTSADNVRRFHAEAETAAKLSHPHTVTLYDFGQAENGLLFIAMELIQGRSLRAEVAATGALPPERVLDIGEQVASSIADAHEHGIVHRDLKPDNVMLSERAGRKDFVRVLDFGIAKLRDQKAGGISAFSVTREGDILGTPLYMSPEQIQGERVDGRTDVYSLGVMLYEMVTGRLPFEAQTVAALLSMHINSPPIPFATRRPDLVIPHGVGSLIMRALAKSRDVRPATMEAVRSEMLQLKDAMVRASGPTHPPSGPIYPPAPPSGPIYVAPPPTGPVYAQPGPGYPAHAQSGSIYGVAPAPQSGPSPAYPAPQSGPSPAYPSPAGAGYPPPQAGPPPGYTPAGQPFPGYPPPPQASGYGAGAYPPAPAGPAYPAPSLYPSSSPGLAPYPQRVGGSNLGIWVLLGILLVGGAGVGIYFLTRSHGSPAAPRLTDDDPGPKGGGDKSASDGWRVHNSKYPFFVDVPQGFTFTEQSEMLTAGRGEVNGQIALISAFALPVPREVNDQELMAEAEKIPQGASGSLVEKRTRNVGGTDRVSVIFDIPSQGLRSEVVLFPHGMLIVGLAFETPEAAFDASSTFRDYFFTKLGFD